MCIMALVTHKRVLNGSALILAARRSRAVTIAIIGRTKTIISFVIESPKAVLISVIVASIVLAIQSIYFSILL